MAPNRRTKAQTTDPAPSGEIGPNGHRIGYTDEGDKVEWIPGDEEPAKERPLILRRGDRAILHAQLSLWRAASSYHIWRKMAALEREVEALGEEGGGLGERAKKEVRRIESEYGKRNLENDYALGLLDGRLSALSWVLGGEWDDPVGPSN